MSLLSNLRVRLVLWTVMLEAALLLTFAIVFVWALQSTQIEQIDETLRLSASQVNAVVDVVGSRYSIPTEDTVTLQARDVLVWLIKPDGTIAATVGEASSLPLPDLPQQNKIVERVLSNEGAVRLYVITLDEDSRYIGTAVLAIPLENSQRFIRQVIASLALALPIVLIFSAIGGLFLAGRALSPVARITETASYISAEDLTQRLMLDLPNDEIGQLAKTFNAMLERLDSAFQRERQLTSDVSHELRTPLALLKTQIGLARSRPRDAQTLLQMILNMEGDVDRMTRLVQQLLTLTRIEHRGVQETDLVDIGAMLNQIANQFQDVAREHSISLEIALPPPPPLLTRGNTDRLAQVFTNLIDNALKYTQANGSVTIRALRAGEALHVMIVDTGVGISAEHLPHLFERFYRVDEARSHAKGGFGLGLAITQEIIRTHDGSITVSSQVDVGTEFTVVLPAFAPLKPHLTL